MRSPSQVGRHEDEIVINGEVDKATAQAKSGSVGHGLADMPDGVFDVLVGERVLQLEGSHGQPVDEDGQVKGRGVRSRCSAAGG